MTEESTTETYTHEPGAFADDSESSDAESDDSAGLSNREGWLIAGALAVLLVGSPMAAYLWPPGFLGLRDAYLAVAMVPGFLLGLLGLWAARSGLGDRGVSGRRIE